MTATNSSSATSFSTLRLKLAPGTNGSDYSHYHQPFYTQMAVITLIIINRSILHSQVLFRQSVWGHQTDFLTELERQQQCMLTISESLSCQQSQRNLYKVGSSLLSFHDNPHQPYCSSSKKKKKKLKKSKNTNSSFYENPHHPLSSSLLTYNHTVNHHLQPYYSAPHLCFHNVLSLHNNPHWSHFDVQCRKLRTSKAIEWPA